VSIVTSNSQNKSGKEYNFKDKTVKELRDFAAINEITIPAGSRKSDIVEILNNAVSEPDFVDMTLEENQPEELVVGEDDDSEIRPPSNRELKFWQKPPYSTLLDLELAKDSDVAFYDLSTLVHKFFENMLSEDFINYKVSGIALKNSASLHRHKITDVIKQEEKIQKQEKIEKMRKRTQRDIPETLSQPIKPQMKTSSQDELFDAMKDAIIDTMRKKEKLKRQRKEREKELERKKEKQSEAQLPKELLKHISGREQTVEELHESWYNRIKTKISLEENHTSLYELVKMIKREENSILGRKYELIRLFLALMFLSTNNKINLKQNQEFKDINISLD
jgi:chromatin segregation and condensation protein Rec8/ScpA/Scc1 (kleisin family)